MQAPDPVPGLYLLPLDESFFPPKRIPLPPATRVRIGRQLNQKSAPGAGNGVFESRVLSRQHAETWIENGRVLIRDVKSSNGTFVNGERLSAEGAESDPYELRSDDILEFGIDIVGEHGEVVHRKVAARVTCALTPADAVRAVRAETRVYPPPNPPPVPPPPASGILGVNPNVDPRFNSGEPPRPQHNTGLAGMGGMGSERIRPKSGVDLDTILARIRDGAGFPFRGASNAGGNAVNGKPPPLHGTPARPAIPGNFIPTLPPPPPAVVDTTASSSERVGDGGESAAESGAPNSEADKENEPLAQIRAGLAETQAALEEAMRVASSMIAGAGESSSEPSSSTLTESAVTSSGTEIPFPGADSAEEKPTSTEPSAIHENTRALREELAALRQEATNLQRARARRARAQTITSKTLASSLSQSSPNKTKSTRRSTVTQRRPQGLGVDALEDLEIDRSFARDEEEEEESGKDDVGEGRRRGENVEEWMDDVDFRAEVADMGMDVMPTPTGSFSRATFRPKQRGGLRNMFVNDDTFSKLQDVFPAEPSAMHSSPTEMTPGVRVGEEEDVGGSGVEVGNASTEEDDDGVNEQELAGLSAQLDALSIQLGTLHGRLRALQAASPTLPLQTSEEDTNFELEYPGDGAPVDGGGRLDVLDARVRALEGAVAGTAQSPSPSSDSPSITSATTATPPSILPTPDPSPSIPTLAPAALAPLDAAVEEEEAALRAGLEALQAEWAAFRAEIAAFPPPPPILPSPDATNLNASTATSGGPGYPPIDPFASDDAFASGMDLYPRNGPERRPLVLDSDEDDSLSSSDTRSTSSLSSDDREPDAMDSSQLSAPRHSRRTAQVSEDEARVPGRWGLLTPEGSVRGEATNLSGVSLTPTTTTSPAAAWLRNASTPTSTTGKAWPIHTEPGSASPVARNQAAVQSEAKGEQRVLLYGAVGAGMMIVAAAWWGA
ncbi:hypothetical protein R3P38DRAFT_2905731 [Favolaschia claudopus]|uniref:FHA domain-containing protein n=1 Tax=Favolaschia claudopus TaxID=2862362 RepID=A0AAW0CFS7_9AGAR